MADLIKLFDKARAASEHRDLVRGILGKPDGTIAVSDRPTHCYVRVSQQGGESITTARNLNVVPLRLNLPVKMRMEPGVGYVIVGLDASFYDAAAVNDVINPYGIPFHTHKTDSGMSYEMEALRLAPGRVFPTGVWGITVNPFRYYYNGAWETYEGEDLDLLGNRPSTTGKHRLVVISVNPTTNTANVTNGSDQNYATELTQADIDAISIGNNLPLCAVRIRADDTSIDDISRFIDAGGWRNRGATALSELIDVEITTPATDDVLTYDNADGVWKNVPGGGGVGFDDSEGQPADVAGTSADGTSTFAARRDHVHTIGSGVVTAVMMQDGAALAEILDDDGHDSGLDADLLDGYHATAFAAAGHTHAGGLSFNDAEEQPADVASANADGTSAYAARRDHVHTIAAGTVTAAMMQDGAALAEILDDDGAGSGLDADLLDGNHAAAFATAGHTHSGSVAAVSLITDWSYRTTDRSTSAFAWKGNEFTPQQEVILYAIGYYGALVANATYKAAVMTASGSPPATVAGITFSNAKTVSASPEADGGWLWLEFASPVTLSAGTVYGLMFGRTDGADNYVLPVPFNGGTSSINAVPIHGLSHGRSWRIAKANPAVGDAIDRVTNNSAGMGYRFRYTGSLY